MGNALNSFGKLNIRIITTAVIAAQIFTISCHKQQPPSPTAIDSGDEKMATVKIAEGDQLYAAREDITKARVAVASYRQAQTADYGNYDAAWKLARACFY